MIDLNQTKTEEQSVRIEILNIMGQTLLTDFTTTNGHLNEFINMPESIVTGTYFARVTVGSNVYTSKVSVSK